MNANKARALIPTFEKLKVTWAKLCVGSSDYYILSKKKPTQERIAGSPVRILEEIDGWWLWTY